MIHSIQAIIHYRHSQDEAADVAQAALPLMSHIRAVASEADRQRLRQITEGQFFVARDVRLLRDMLLRAANHARANLGDYFPMIQESVIAQAEHLEDTARAYHRRFRSLQANTIPVN